MPQNWMELSLGGPLVSILIKFAWAPPCPLGYQ